MCSSILFCRYVSVSIFVFLSFRICDIVISTAEQEYFPLHIYKPTEFFFPFLGCVSFAFNLRCRSCLVSFQIVKDIRLAVFQNNHILSRGQQISNMPNKNIYMHNVQCTYTQLRLQCVQKSVQCKSNIYEDNRGI